MKIRSSIEIDSMRKYSSDLASSSEQNLSEAKKGLDSASHLLMRTPLTRRDMKDALRYVNETRRALKEALRDSTRSDKVSRKALKAEKTARRALLKEEKKMIADMKKAEPAELAEVVVKGEETEPSKDTDGEVVVEAETVED